MDWEYLDMSKQICSEFVSFGDGTYELVVVVGASQPRRVVLATEPFRRLVNIISQL